MTTALGITRSLLNPVFRAFGRAAARSAQADDYVVTPGNGGFYIPSTFNPIDVAALKRGEYESAESDILRDHFRPDRTIIEIGANIGYVSRLACETKLMTGGTYVAIEANSVSIPSLQKNLPDNNVHILNAAIGIPASHEGELQSFIPRQNLSSGLESVLKTGMFESRTGVPVRSLSSVAREFDRAGKGYSLICDAEGAEILILQQDPGSLEKCRQVAIELHHPNLTGSDVTPKNMIGIFETLGFKHRYELHDTHYFCRP